MRPGFAFFFTIGGWTCQYATGIPTKQQCAVYGDAELPADGLTVEYHPTATASKTDVPQGTVQKIADSLYAGHGYD